MVGLEVSHAPVWAQTLLDLEPATLHSFLSSQEALVHWNLRGGEYGQKQTCALDWEKTEVERLEDRLGVEMKSHCDSDLVLVLPMWGARPPLPFPTCPYAQLPAQSHPKTSFVITRQAGPVGYILFFSKQNDPV